MNVNLVYLILGAIIAVLGFILYENEKQDKLKHSVIVHHKYQPLPCPRGPRGPRRPRRKRGGKPKRR